MVGSENLQGRGGDVRLARRADVEQCQRQAQVGRHRPRPGQDDLVGP
jgi:hypothetical protein